METKIPTGGEKLVQCLEREGVEYIFGLSGGAEIRAWQAAFAALASAGRYEAELLFYRPIPEWIVGMGVMHAHLS